MTLRLESTDRAEAANAPLGGAPADRLARLPGVVAELRRADAEAERDRVLQYWAVERLRRTGVLGLRVPVRYGGPARSLLWKYSARNPAGPLPPPAWRMGL